MKNFPLTVAGVAAGGAALYGFLTAPSVRRHEAAACFMEVCYAHRGLHGNGIPENSMPAFAAAIREGYGIETDVQLTADGIPVLFHDDTLDRICGVPGRVRDFTLAELQRYPLSGTAEHIPTLEEFLALLTGRVPLLLEIKAAHNCTLTCARTWACMRTYGGAWCMESFHPLALSYFRRHAPHIVRGQLSAAFTREKEMSPMRFLQQNFLFNCAARPDFISYYFKHADFFSFRLQRKLYKIPTAAWTVKSQEDAEAAAGFDTLIFENIRPKAKRGTQDGI